MDLEVSSPQAESPTLLRELRRFILDPQGCLGEWTTSPPTCLGSFVLLLVVLELVLAQRLVNPLNPGLPILLQFFVVAAAFLAVELLVAKVSQLVARLFQKEGSIITTLTFLNLNLSPLLLFLPITLLCWMSGGDQAFRMVVLILLLFKVWQSWKKAIQISYGLTFFQGTIAMGLATAALGMGVFLLVYVSVVGIVAEMFLK